MSQPNTNPGYVRLQHLLREVLQDAEGLVDLAGQRLGRVEERKKLLVVHLQEHTGDLAGELRLLTKGKTNQRSLRSTQQPTLTAQS